MCVFVSKKRIPSQLKHYYYFWKFNIKIFNKIIYIWYIFFNKY